MRAPTPSAAAELAAPSMEQLTEKINILERRISNSANNILNKAADRYSELNSRLSVQSPENRLKLSGERLNSLEKRLELSAERYISVLDSQLNEKLVRLDSLSPVKVLSRGYSLVYSGDKLISDAEKLNTGDIIKIRFGSGEAEAEIIKK